MFLNATLRRNEKLVKNAFKLHNEGIIRPDTYILDVDTIVENAKYIKKEGDKHGIQLYFMTKQLGRNPYISKKIMELGYSGAVCVDFKEAEVLHEQGVKIGHVGHLVQIPSSMVEDVLKMNPEVITVYSIEKAEEISKAAANLNKTQELLLRVIDEGDMLYPAQYGGFYLDELVNVAEKIRSLPNVRIVGLTSFPCFLYNKENKEVQYTKNVDTLKKAGEQLQNKLGIKITQMNMPSVTCAKSICNISKAGGTHGEPGHGILGTTPMHADFDLVEKPAMVYVSEISHNLKGSSFAYGGGHYRRSHMEKAIVGKSLDDYKIVETEDLNNESIDYYFELKDNAEIGNTVIFSFRTQIFVTRSEVAVVEGIQNGNPRLIGIYDSQGNFLRS